MKKIDSIEQFNQLAEGEDPFFMVKHSLTCPISQEAFQEYETFANETSVPCYYLAVQEARSLSNHIAEHFHIKHESPQAILFTKGNVGWHASHWKITQKSLTAALEEIN
ncbi:bacillithiol system redox-active protein YtxJ [Mesobacillus maritimus]|uniref:bacillithiol system redox-active protein YtxJ n=1 Tax=Mesobacillus maritimus TaxID=1643336 RepID=UPI002040964D|nr:bacillithiol system redox-active protein YtxJ [Mesobacillus maritimus]MCM3670082.1 bacillithiol system redox-active protein YtxJ [Mesobacillus maritimus]